MKRLFVVALLALVVPCLAFGQAAAQKAASAKGQTEEQQVSALERAWIDAAQKYDVAWFERNIADTFINTDEEGVVTDKPAMVADVKNHADTFESLTYDDLKVKVYGDTAIAYGTAVIKGTSKGKPVNSRSQWTDTWIKRAGKWQCVASQGTTIVKK
jgi:ketosteroid isomerase-like protein